MNIFILLKTPMITDRIWMMIMTLCTLIKIVKFLRRGKAPGPGNIHNEVLRLGTTHLIVPSFSTAFYLFHTNRLHPNCMETSYPPYVTET